MATEIKLKVEPQKDSKTIVFVDSTDILSNSQTGYASAPKSVGITLINWGTQKEVSNEVIEITDDVIQGMQLTGQLVSGIRLAEPLPDGVYIGKYVALGTLESASLQVINKSKVVTTTSNFTNILDPTSDIIVLEGELYEIDRTKSVTSTVLELKTPYLGATDKLLNFQEGRSTSYKFLVSYSAESALCNKVAQVCHNCTDDNAEELNKLLSYIEGAKLLLNCGSYTKANEFLYAVLKQCNPC